MMKRSEVVMLPFLLRADEFYLLTRFSNRAFLQYMAYRMAHHTLEYYLKAGLSIYFTTNDMKKLGHNIDDLWKKYKPLIPDTKIDARIISHINKFETMRYPDSNKFVRTLWGASYDELFSEVLSKVPDEVKHTIACFYLPDFDKIVYALRNSLPQGNLLPIIATTKDREIYLFYKNKYFSKKENKKKLKSASK